MFGYPIFLAIRIFRMKTYILQHIDFEGPGAVADWAPDHSVVRVDLDEPYPDLDQIDLLVIMGGPMGVHDEKKFPWLVKEKRFIENHIARGRKAIGFCLGAQLLADVLGANVKKNRVHEIGWLPVYSTSDNPNLLPESFEVFHWHGDTFDIPQGALHIARSEFCENQAFILNSQVLALQFHPEMTPDVAKALYNIFPVSDEEASVSKQVRDEALASEERFIKPNEIGKRIFQDFLNL